MATQIVDLSTLEISEEYSQVADENPTLKGDPEEVWADVRFESIPSWGNISLAENEILTFGLAWLHDFATGSITVRTAIRGLRLALSLRSMVGNKHNPLLSHPTRSQEHTKPFDVLPEIETFNGVPFRSRGQELTPGMIADPTNLADLMTTFETFVARELVPETRTIQNTLANQAAFCFLAAFMMKSLAKSPENVLNGIQNMRGRFESFYGPSEVITAFTISHISAKHYKDALLSQHLISSTYTVAVAYTNSHLENLDPREVGVLSYVAFLPLSYTGFHSYTLLMELKNLTGARLDRLLTLFHVDVTRAALSNIVRIIRDFERTTLHPARSVLFRYCSFWGPQYFQSLRSKNCPHLVYAIASAWKNLSSVNPNADPSQIAAAESLSDNMKRTLAAVGLIIANTLQQEMFSGPRASPAFAMAGEAPVVAPQATEEPDWDDLLINP